MKPLIVCLTLLTLTLVLALPLRAQDAPAETAPPADPATAAGWDALGEQARQMQAQAARLRTESQQAHAAAERDCWKKFLVSDCLDDAKAALRTARQEARRLEVEAGRIERRITEHERRERVARKLADKQAEITQRRADSAGGQPSGQ